MTLATHLAALLRARDPVAELHRRLGGELDPPVRAALAAIDHDGLRTAALLVARLRFERVVQGGADIAERFERDPAGFGARFRRYHESQPARSLWPADEAAQFEAFIAEDF